jgi:hypothetical protein
VANRILGTLGFVAVLALVLATGASAVSASRQVVMRDACDPETFNAVLGPGACVKDGDTMFSTFVGQLLAQGRAPAWRFAPGHLGLTPVPECAGFPGGTFAATAVPPGGTLSGTLAPGVHRFECLIHPWMRTTVVVP